MRHIENPGIVRTAYLRIFRYVQGHFIQPWPGIFRDNEAYSDIFRTLYNSCIYNLLNMEDDQAYLEPWLSQHFIQVFSRIFDGYLRMLVHIQRHSQGKNVVIVLNVVLTVSRRKNANRFPNGMFFSSVFLEVFVEVL